MKKYVYCTLDTETVGGACNPTGTYNLGGIIHYADGTEIASFSFIVANKFDEIRNDDYAKKNFHLYGEKIRSGMVSSVVSEDDAIENIRKLCSYYGVRYIMCYNTGFDLVKTCCKALTDEFQFIDLYLMALQTVTHLKKYKAFCEEHQLFSQSGKCYSTSAETVYAFIKSDSGYSEEHTAFEDSKIEKEIFVYCRNMHKKYTRNMHQWDCKEHKCFPRPNKRK